MLKRKVSPSKRPSTMKVRSRPSNLSQGNGLGVSRGDAALPKTRFSLNDRSCSSPRLKSFPAEQIKRLEPPSLQNSQDNVDTSRQMHNSGQGDTLVQQSGLQSHLLSQPFGLQNQNISSMSEQQVPRAICPVNEQVNLSELVIPSPAGIASNARPHRPNVPHTNTTIRDHYPRNPVSPQLTRSPQSVHQTEIPGPNEKESNQYQYRGTWGIENDSIMALRPEKSVGARCTDFHHPSVHAERNENINVNGPIPQRSIGGPNVSNLCSLPEEKPANWSQPQTIYQSHPPNVSNCYNNNVQEKIVRRQLVESNPGIFPQDVAINQKQNSHRAVQLGSNSQNPWIQDNRAQPQSYVMNIVTPGNVNPDSTVCYQHIRESGMPVKPNPYQMLHGNSEAQQQYYHQQEQIPSQTRSSPTNNLKTPADDHQPKKEDDKKKTLKFSSAMIKDQEALVMTMRQQRIPEDIMRRQFDALLAEQRKQLLYFEKLEQGEFNNSKTVTQGRRVQRKISKIEEDGKPEWMLHVTPPRIPYSVIEKMRSEREVNFQQIQNGGNSLEVPPPDVPPQLYDQMAQENCSQTWQNGGTNARQQSIPLSHDCSNANVTNQQQTFSTINHHSEQPQIGYHGYPVQQSLQQQHYVQQVPQGRCQGGVNNTREDIQQVQRHQQAEKTLEPSSLLKLRLYKEVIRKQKQNNGLQDSETVKEAMEALKNPVNLKGLEYLDKLNKKPEKPVSLNGAQDPQEHSFLMNGSPPGQYLCQPAKMPSANGLENQRNPNNPSSSSSSILHQKKLKEPQWPEYPRQKTKGASRDYYSLKAERENGIVASFIPNDNHKSHPAMVQNPTTQNATPAYGTHIQSISENGGQFPGQSHQGIVCSAGKSLAAVSESMPFTFAQQKQDQYHTGHMQQLNGNPSNYSQANIVNSRTPQLCFSMGGPIDGGSGNVQQQYNHNKTNEIQEMIMSGGFKYLARKPEYIPNSSYPPSHHNVNSGKYLYPTIPCQ